MLKFLFAPLAVVFLLGPSDDAYAQVPDDCTDQKRVAAGTITATGKTAGLIIGKRWADGVLTLNDGTSYKFKAQGWKMMETGYTEVEITGTVYNLQKPEHFEGTYSGISSGVAVLKGLGGASMGNKNCVIINASSKTEGVRLSAPVPNGISIEFVK